MLQLAYNKYKRYVDANSNNNNNNLHLTGHFPGKPHSVTPQFFLHLFRTEPLGINGTRFFIGPLSFLSPNQQCKRTKESTKH